MNKSENIYSPPIIEQPTLSCYTLIAPGGAVHQMNTIYDMERAARLLAYNYFQLKSYGGFVIITPEGKKYRGVTKNGVARIIRKVIREYFEIHPEETKPSYIEKLPVDDAFKRVEVREDGKLVFKRPIFTAIRNPNPFDLKIPDARREFYEKYFKQHPMREPVAVGQSAKSMKKNV